MMAPQGVKGNAVNEHTVNSHPGLVDQLKAMGISRPESKADKADREAFKAQSMADVLALIPRDPFDLLPEH